MNYMKHNVVEKKIEELENTGGNPHVEDHGLGGVLFWQIYTFYILLKWQMKRTIMKSSSSLVAVSFNEVLEVIFDGNKAPNFLKAPAVQDLDPHLNPNYNFENFIEGYSNKLSRSVAEAVAQKPGGTAFNPLFLYGASGVGKTHLANAKFPLNYLKRTYYCYF